MKKLTPLLLLVASMAYGQAQKQGPSQFDKFVQTPSIEWAMYVEDTIQLETPHMNKILAKRFEKNEIKAAYALEVEWGDLNNIRFSKKKDLDNHVLVPRIDTTYDSTGYTNPVSSAQRNHTIDSSGFYLTEFTEIFYIEKDQLKSYVPWVNVKIPMVTETGFNLGYGTYFSTCFNLDRNYKPAANNKILFLKRSGKKITPDSIPNFYRLKEMYGMNMIDMLWPSIMSNKFELISLRTNKKIKAEGLQTGLISDIIESVPLYDADGNLAGSKIVSEKLLPSNFTSIDLVQDWYYDYTRNIVFTKIKELYLYAHINKAAGLDKEATPVLKIVLNK